MFYGKKNNAVKVSRMSILRDKLTEELGRCWRTRGIVLPVLCSKPTVLVVFVWDVYCGFFCIVDRNRAQTMITVRILCQSLPKFGDSNNVGSWYNCTIQCTIHTRYILYCSKPNFLQKIFLRHIYRSSLSSRV